MKLNDSRFHVELNEFHGSHPHVSDVLSFCNMEIDSLFYSASKSFYGDKLEVNNQINLS